MEKRTAHGSDRECGYSSPATLDWVKAHRADIVIDYHKDDFATILLRPTGSRFRERHGIVLDRETVHAPVELYKNSLASIEAERQQPVPLAGVGDSREGLRQGL